MENLPKPLLALLNCVMSEYDNFAWNSMYADDKMKISLVWTNDESRNMNLKRRKSRASKKRDANRMEEFIVTKEQSDIISDVEMESTNETATINQIEDHEVVIPTVNPEVSSFKDQVVEEIQLPIFDNRVDGEGEIRTDSSITVNISNGSLYKDDSVRPNLESNKCTDGHFERVVHYKANENDYMLGKVKMDDTIVKRKVTVEGTTMDFFEKDDEEEREDYDRYSKKLYRFRDVLESDNDNTERWTTELRTMNDYVDEYGLCPLCNED